MNKYIKMLIPIEIAKALCLTGKHFLRVFLTANRRKTPLHVVSEYPEVPTKLQPRFRGRLTMLKNENGEAKCVCCMACEKICPTNAITIVSGKKEGRKSKIPLHYNFEMERCAFCGFCVESCAFDAITLNHQFELAAYNREDFSIGMLGQASNLFDSTAVGSFTYSESD